MHGYGIYKYADGSTYDGIIFTLIVRIMVLR